MFPDGVTGIFHWHNPSGRTKALGSTRPLTEMSTRNISWGSKSDRCVGPTTLPPSCAECLEICEPQPPGTLRACPGIASHLPLLPLAEKVEGLPSQGQGDGWFLKIAYILENYIWIDDWYCCYIRGSCCYVCCNKQGRKPHALRGICWYHRVKNVIAKVLHILRSL